MADQACDFPVGKVSESGWSNVRPHTESDAIQREGGFCVRSLFLHSDNLIEARRTAPVGG